MELLYSIELLYPTDIPVSPGIIRLDIYSPRKNRLPVFIKGLDGNDPTKYIPSIANIVQDEVLNKINVDIKTQVDLFIDDGKKRYHVYFNRSVDQFELKEE